MDYEAIDRDAVQYLVSCVVKATRFYLTDEKLATDIQSRAARYSMAQADAVARAEMARTGMGNTWGELFRWQTVRRLPNGEIL